VSTASTHAAVVLAAGGSRRLGRPKQLLTRGGETLVHRTARLALGTSPRRMLVVVGARRDEVADALSDLACEIVCNPSWERGLAGSLHAAAAALTGHDGAVLIAGCDQPALEAVHLQRLLAGAGSAASRCAATRHGDAPGVPAVVPAALLAQVRALEGDRGLAPRLRALPHGDMFLLDAPALGFDLDTEDDVRMAIARGWLDP
jgi:molybdenum cofactor cytidylyltransferase